MHILQRRAVWVNLVLSVIPVLGGRSVCCSILATLVLWIMLLIKACQGQEFKLLVVGDLAESRLLFKAVLENSRH